MKEAFATDDTMKQYRKDGEIRFRVFYSIKQTMEILDISRTSFYYKKKKWTIIVYKRNVRNGASNYVRWANIIELLKLTKI